MQAFTTLTATVIPLPMKDVDTDMIIPAQFLTQINREGYGDALFKRLREQDSEFVFNQARFKQAKILVSESNFGCGSSREHAVWALQQWGIKVVIASSFSDIFFNNAAKNGLLLIQLPADVINSLILQAQSHELTLEVDLATQRITTINRDTITFEYDSFRKQCLLNGYDDLDYLLAAMDKIDHYSRSKA